jgi:hypothetical protein
MGREHGLCVYTTAASISIQTKACSFMGLVAFASAACTITIADSARAIFAGSTNAGGFLSVMPPVPIACTGGLSVTDSGGGNYVIFYGKG